MSLNERPFYSVVCDEPGCDADAQEGGDFAAWSEAGHAYDEAINCEWQVLDGVGDYCPEHRRISLDKDDYL